MTGHLPTRLSGKRPARQRRSPRSGPAWWGTQAEDKCANSGLGTSSTPRFGAPPGRSAKDGKEGATAAESSLRRVSLHQRRLHRRSLPATTRYLQRPAEAMPRPNPTLSSNSEGTVSRPSALGTAKTPSCAPSSAGRGRPAQRWRRRWDPTAALLSALDWLSPPRHLPCLARSKSACVKER